MQNDAAGSPTSAVKRLGGICLQLRCWSLRLWRPAAERNGRRQRRFERFSGISRNICCWRGNDFGVLLDSTLIILQGLETLRMTFSDGCCCLTFFSPQNVCNCMETEVGGGVIRQVPLQLEHHPEVFIRLDIDGGRLRVFLAESSTKSEEMSSSTPTSFLAMQV